MRLSKWVVTGTRISALGVSDAEKQKIEGIDKDNTYLG